MIPLLLGAVSAFAQIPDKPPETIVSQKGMLGLIQIINTSSNTIFGVIILIAVLFILFSAFTIMTSGGDEGKLKKGKAMLKNTLIGLVIALLSVSIVLITISLLDLSSSPKYKDNNESTRLRLHIF